MQRLFPSHHHPLQQRCCRPEEEIDVREWKGAIRVCLIGQPSLVTICPREQTRANQQEIPLPRMSTVSLRRYSIPSESTHSFDVFLVDTVLLSQFVCICQFGMLFLRFFLSQFVIEKCLPEDCVLVCRASHLKKNER